MWQDEPACCIDHLAMKVIAIPAASAISRQPCLNTEWLSAASSASAYVMLISCWPWPASPLENSIGMPAASMSLRILRMTCSSRVVCSMW